MARAKLERVRTRPIVRLRPGVDFPDVTENRTWRNGRFGPVVVSVTENETLVLDYMTNRYRCAWYRHENTGEHGKPAKRSAYEHADLRKCLDVIIGDCDSGMMPEIIESYIRSTAWGMALPR